MSAPQIGITQPLSKSLNIPYWAIKLAIRVSGGQPIVIKHIDDLTQKKIDGLLLGGGTDVFPGLYNLNPKENYRYDHARDSLELACLKHTENNPIPVLAICRGAQLMNIFRGGDLHMDIREVFKEANYPGNFWGYAFFRKQITVEKESLLFKVFSSTEVMVNSIHKQAIKRLGDRLNITATETSNGIIQTIEDPNRLFYMGVQFHPELLLYRKPVRRLFKVFIQSAKEAM